MRTLFAPFYSLRLARRMAAVMILMVGLNHAGASASLTDDLWRMMQTFMQQTHVFVLKFFPAKPVTAPALVIPAPQAEPIHHARVRKPQKTAVEAVVIPSGVRLHDSPSHLPYRLHLTARVKDTHGLAGGTLVSAEVQSGDEIVTAKTTLQDDGTYAIIIPFNSHINARVDWHLAMQTPGGQFLESAGRTIVEREEQDVYIDVPEELQIVQKN